MSIQVKKAQRKRVKLKIGLAAPSGAGKTASSLILAYGLLKGEHPDMSDADIWNRIAMIDTENGSGELYANMTVGKCRIGEYLVVSLEPPFDPQDEIDAIKACKEAGAEVIITDSLSHFWAGTGGLLDKQAEATKRNNGNSYTAWRTITPLYNEMIDSILQTDCHMIVTLRSKTEYAQDTDERGKKVVKKLGMAPVIRDGCEYEFSLFMDLNNDHEALVTKDRTNTLDGKCIVITPETGMLLANWLSGAAAEDAPPTVVAEVKPTVKKTAMTIDEAIAKVAKIVAEKQDAGVPKDEIKAALKAATGKVNFNKFTDIGDAKAAFKAVKALEPKADAPADDKEDLAE